MSKIFTRLPNIFTNFSKCYFYKNNVRFLNYILETKSAPKIRKKNQKIETFKTKSKLKSLEANDYLLGLLIFIFVSFIVSIKLLHNLT